MISKLVKIANQLDVAGQYDLADELDTVIKCAADKELDSELEGIDEESFGFDPVSQGPGSLTAKLERLAERFAFEKGYVKNSEGFLSPSPTYGKYTRSKENLYGDDRDPVNVHRYEFTVGDANNPYEHDGEDEDTPSSDDVLYFSLGSARSFLSKAEEVCPDHMSIGDIGTYITQPDKLGKKKLVAYVEYSEVH
jgi:hypothetical protein